MEDIYINIIERLGAEVPELSLIDEDYGQLEMDETIDHDPVTYPCALIGYTDTQWSDINGSTSQRGQAQIIVRTAIDCYDTTSLASGTYGTIRDRFWLARRVHKTLHHYKAADNMSALTRIRSREYALPGGIKVFETTYIFRITDPAD